MIRLNNIKIKFGKICTYIKRFFCSHKNSQVLCWRIINYPEFEPKHIVAKMHCNICGATWFYEIYGEKEQEEFEQMVGIDKYDCSFMGSIIPDKNYRTTNKVIDNRKKKK